MKSISSKTLIFHWETCIFVDAILFGSICLIFRQSMSSVAHRGARFAQKTRFFDEKNLDSGGKTWILEEKHGFWWKNVDSAGNKIDPQTRGNKSCRPFDGETPCPRPRPYLPPRIFLPRACSSFPTGLGHRPSRGNSNNSNNSNNNNMNTIAFSWGPVPPSRPGNFG